MELVLFALVGLLACCLAGSVWRAIAKRDSTRGAWSSCRPAVEWLSELPALRRVVDPANLPFLPVVELLAQRIVPAATSAKFEWTGAVSMAWDNAGNWTRMEGTAGQYPGDEGADDVNDQAIFTGNRPNKCVLSSDRTVKNLYMNFNQALEVTNGATLTVKGLIEPGPMGKDFEFQMYGGTLRLKDNAKLNLQGKTVHLYKGGFIDSGGTGVGSIFVSDNSLFYMSIDGTYLGANLVVGKDAAGNESQGRVDLGLLNGNIKLFKNANITIHKQGTLTLEQARDSDTKGGIDRDVGTTSKIENYGKIIRTTKDLGNKYLKIVPPVEGLGDDSVLELGKGCLIDFVNEYKHNAGTFKKGDGSDIKGFNPRGGKTMLLDPGAPGRYFTYISGDVSFTDGSIQFVNTTPGAFVTLVVSGDLTLGPNVTVSINVDGSTAELSDTIEVDGLATIDAAHLSTITKTASPAPGQLYTFLTATDGLSGTGWAADPINSGYQAQSIFPALNQLQAVSPSSSLASSTGRAWFDANNDGIRDMSELPLANVMVYLYDDQDHLIAPALTDANGQYSFWGVPAGDYYLVFSNPVGQENWYTFSPQDVGNDDTKDSDVDSYGQTATFTLTTAQSMTGIDAGFVSLPPVAEDDTASTPINTPVTVAVLDNDSDPEGAELTVVSVNQPNHGSAVINPDNTITYTPSLGFLGTDTFSYTVQDPTGATSTAVVSVIVTKGETTTTLTSSANPSTSGQMVTLTATVLPAGGSGMVTGTVTFLDGTTVLGTAPVMGNMVSPCSACRSRTPAPIASRPSFSAAMSATAAPLLSTSPSPEPAAALGEGSQELNYLRRPRGGRSWYNERMSKSRKQANLFQHAEDAHLRQAQPLAARMRPRTLDEFIGQEHFLGPASCCAAANARPGMSREIGSWLDKLWPGRIANPDEGCRLC